MLFLTICHSVLKPKLFLPSRYGSNLETIFRILFHEKKFIDDYNSKLLWGQAELKINYAPQKEFFIIKKNTKVLIKYSVMIIFCLRLTNLLLFPLFPLI